MTVKGLEPEIQRILEKHKAELEGVRAGHRAEVKETERRVKAEMLQEIERLKVDFQREKEMACMSEREIARQRSAHGAKQMLPWEEKPFF
jgi:5-azacytidine-induced protein 1